MQSVHSTLPHPAPPRTCVVTTHPCPAKHNIPPAAASTGNCAVRQRNSRVVAVWPAAGGQKSQGYSGGGAGCVLVLRCRCCWPDQVGGVSRHHPPHPARTPCCCCQSILAGLAAPPGQRPNFISCEAAAGPPPRHHHCTP